MKVYDLKDAEGRIFAFEVDNEISSSSLGKRESPVKTAWGIVGWWEERRIPGR